MSRLLLAAGSVAILRAKYFVVAAELLDCHLEVPCRRQECGAEASTTCSLAKARRWHHAHARRLEQRERIEHIDADATLRCRRPGSIGHAYGGVCVHAALRVVARETVDGVEPVDQQLRLRAEGLLDRSCLGGIQLVRFVTTHRRAHHERRERLARHTRAQLGARKLEELRLNVRVNVVQLHVPATPAALADETLGRRVERDELQSLRLSTHLQRCLPRRDELMGAVHILLVHFVRQEDQSLLDAEADHALQCLAREDLAGGVAWVDDDASARLMPPRTRRVE
mmetsp:Transcript_2927/g.7688  ORF Transcript_2927/g.7688 Transcript_2927/m.7688 type:complete len:283 (-) Transcript_2927:762-1610(-)